MGEADANGNKTYFCQVTLSDSSKKYTNPEDSGVSQGNSTSVVYLYDDIYDDFLSSKKGAGLSPTDFSSVLNGTATDKQLSGKGVKTYTVTQIEEALKSKAVDTSNVEDKSLSFSLNPDADPTYTIASFGLTYNDAGTVFTGSTNKAMGEQPVTIIVSAGLDQVNIVPSSLKVWIKNIGSYNNDLKQQDILSKEDLSGQIKELVDSVKYFEENEKDFSSISDVEGWTLMFDNSADTNPSDTNVNLNTKIPDGNFIEAYKYYAIVVTGHDKDDVDISQSTLYGFEGTISAIPPSVSFKSPKNLAYFANSKYSEGSDKDKLIFTGTATENNSGMSLKKLTATLSVSDESTGETVGDSVIIEITGDSEHNWTTENGFSCVYDDVQNTNKWTFVPSECDEYLAANSVIKAENEDLMYMYTLTVEATGTGELKYSETRSVHIDTTKPVVTITSVTPTVSGSEYFGENSEYKDYIFINGTISIKGNINEQNLEKVTYDVWASEDLNKELSESDSILIDLRDFVRDLKSQGVLPENTQDIDGDLGRLFLISQNFPTGLITQYFINRGKIPSDQPIKARIVLKAKDTVGNIGEYNSSESNEGKNFIIYQETDRPKITLGNADLAYTVGTSEKSLLVDSEGSNKENINYEHNLFGTTNNNKLSISVTDDDGVIDYEIYICKEDENFVVDAETGNEIPTNRYTPEKTSASVNYSLPESEGVYKVKITAHDYISTEVANHPMGSAAVGPFFIAVDSGAPTLSLSNPTDGSFTSRAAGIVGENGNNHGVTGKISKREGVKLSGFIYANGDQAKTHLVELTDVSISSTATNGVFDWAGTIAKMPESGESFKLDIMAEDAYGQSSVVTVTLGIDESAPKITLSADEDEDFKTSKKILETNANYSVKDGVNRYLVTGTWCDEYTNENGAEVKGTGTSELYCAYATELEAGQPKWIPLYGTKTVNIAGVETEVLNPIPGTAKSTAETSFNIYIPLTESSTFAWKIWGKDVAGNTTVPNEADGTLVKGITVDLGSPKISKTSADLPEYVRKGEILTIAGNYEDSYGINALSVKAQFKPFGEAAFTEVTKGEKGYTFTDSPAPDRKSGTFTVTVNPESLKSEGEWKFDITVTDLAGRTASITGLSTTIDTIAPKGVHALDDSSKDVYFRIGDTNNDEKEIALAEAPSDVKYDQKVGGKYSENTYGNANTITIRGKIEDPDSGSGVNMIYYKVVNNPADTSYAALKAQAESFLAHYSENTALGYTGYFAPLAQEKFETKRVFFTSGTGKISEKVIDAENKIAEAKNSDGTVKYVVEAAAADKITTIDGDTKYYTDITTNYSATLSGFEEGKNYLILVAVDKAGNAAIDAVVAGNPGDDTLDAAPSDGTRHSGTYFNASLNVDTVVPLAEQTGDTEMKYTNGASGSRTTITGKATDDAAGVKSIVISVNDKEIKVGDKLETAATYGSLTIDSKSQDGKEWTWTAVLKNDRIFDDVPVNTAAKTFSVNAAVTDCAGIGNSQSYSVGNIIVDKKAPTVTLTAPVDRDTDIEGRQINGKISLEGTVKDENVLPETAITGIRYRKSTGTATWSAWTDVTGITLSGNYTFDADDFDTTQLEDGTYELKAIAVDNAGNVGESEAQTVIISQASDRPKVQINNLANVGTADSPVYILKFGTNAQIGGTVKDDDSSSAAVVKEFIVSDSAITVAEDGTLSGNTGTLKTWTAASGDWIFEPANTDDGSKNIYFYVKDNFDKVFYTGSATLITQKSTAVAQPYFQFKTEEKTVNSSYITYRSDGTAPTVSSTKVRVFSDAEGNNVLTDASGNAIADEALSGSVYLGGSRKRYVKFVVQSYDANGIAGMGFTLEGKATRNLTVGDKTVTKGETLTLSYNTAANWEDGKTGVSNDSPAEWVTDIVDLSQFESGSIACTAVATDTSDLPGNTTPTFNVDNTAPVISIAAPNSTEELTGRIAFTGTSIDSGSGTAETAWLIPTVSQAAFSDTILAGLKDSTETSLWNSTYDDGKNEGSWQFTLSSELSAYDNSTYAGSNISDGVYTLPFYIMATDELGNIAIKKDFTFKHNPDADRPKTEIIYPNEASYIQNEKHVTLSGSIRISGSAIIPSNTTSVAAVYLQIEKGEASTSGTSTTISYTSGSSYISGLQKDGKAVYTAYDAASVASDLNKTLQFADASASSGWWGIKAEKTSAWSCTINAKEEMKPTDNELTYIRFRACAVNEEGKVGTWTPWYNINIDNNAPSQTATLYQFKTTQPSTGCTASTILAESNITARNIYEGDMYLKGDWYLAIKVRDNSAISTAATSVTGKSGSPITKYESTVTGGENQAKEQYLFIKVERSETYTVSVSDGENTVKNVYYLNRDDNAPVIESVYKGSDSEATANHLAEYSAASSKVNTVEDENYVWAIGGRNSENGSGFKRLVFYYVRQNNTDGRTYSNPVILDPMITTSEEFSKAAISGLSDRILTQGTDTYHLYSKSVAGKLGSDGYSFTPTTPADITGNAHIRKGGLIEAGGVLRRIDSIDSTSGAVTFDTNTGVTAETNATVYFPYAQVVDNTVAEVVSNSTGKNFTFKTDSPDDGDGMPEVLRGNSSSGYSWESTIHSSNMPDGPCALVVLAFDAAGNVSGKTYSMNIQNRAPRLAKVFLGTDLNSNNFWVADEFVGYNLYAANEGAGITVTEVKEKQSIATAKYDEKNSPFQIKDKLAVISEFVGGNGEISMVYKKGATTTDAVPSSGTGAGTVASANATITSLIGTDDKVGSVTYHSNATSTSLMGFTLTSKEVAGLADSDTLSATNGNVSGVNASFTFWDSTDEGASQSCVLQISDLTLALVDAASPKVVVNPFYWDSESSNSLYKNNRTNGHIELESDLTGTGAATLYGSDPKVSGKVTFTGTAYDDHTLGSLKFTLSRPVTKNNTTTETAYEGFEDVAMATYDPVSTAAAYVTNGGWSRLSGNSGSSVANGGKYEWTISRTSTTEEINARKYGDSCYLSQEGHKIYWTITIDTEQISDVAAEDVKLTVTATDKSNLASTGATVTSSSPVAGKTDAKENHVPVYQMDVVPYITKVYTRISKNAGEEFARSATGRYSLNQAETFRLFGFNLDKTTANNTVKTTVTFTADGATNGTNLTVTLPVNTDTEDKEILDNTALGSHIKVSAANITTKGSLKVSVNGVSSLNNDNAEPEFTENDRKAYNSQANGITNNLLNDDVKIYLWTTGAFDTVMSGHGANVTSPMMKFDTNGNYYISYGQGAKLFAINKNSTDTTLESCYNKYHNTNVAFDGSGNFYGVATDTDRIDTSTTGATSFTFFSRTLGYGPYSGTYLYSNSHNHGNYTVGTDKRRLELSQYDGQNNNTNDTGTYNINRVQRPKLTVSGNSDTAKVYMAYYDASANNVKFRYGTVSGTERYNNNGERTSRMTGGIANDLTGNGTDTGTNASSAAGYHLIANNSTTYKGGAYTAVGYTDNGDAVVAWYDASKRQLVFSYNTAANIAKTTFTNGSPNDATVTAQNAWQTNAVVIDSDYAGWYVDLAVDSDNGVHIAYYKSSSGDLKYAYISDYTDAVGSKTVVTVDSYLSVGTNITINLKDKVPYIYYYNTSANQTTNSIKVAWQNGTLGNGAENDKFTGKWECMTIPTSNIPNDATVSGGVPTDGTYNGEVVLGYMTDLYFEKAELK